MPKRRRRRSNKGTPFERWLCHLLSEWWTDGRRSDIFWRTAGSGARAHSRGKRGKKTHGQHGDICAIDPIGEPLIDVMIIEAKRGYSKHTIAQVVDRPDHSAQKPFEEWLEQTLDAYERSGSFAWALVTKRDGAEPLIFMPTYLWEALVCPAGDMASCPHSFYFYKMPMRIGKGMRLMSLVSMQLRDFLVIVRPNKVEELHQQV